jgi:DNA-3-methyladenine glycosylase II
MGQDLTYMGHSVLFMTTGTLPASQPFDLRTSIRFLEGFGPCRGDQVMTDETITKAVAVDGQAFVFHVSPHPDGVAYELVSDRPIADARPVLAKISDYLSLSDDLTEFYAQAADDVPNYARIVQALRGLHHVRFLTLAEVGVWAVLTQRTPKQVSLPLKRRITEQFGRTIRRDGLEFRTFPELADLQSLTAADWMAVVGNERKARYLANLVAGLLDIGEDYLRTASYVQADRALRAITGVGEFTAAFILLRGLGRMDHVPLDMPAFADAITRVYGPGYDHRKLRARYGHNLGYFAYYLRAGLGALGREAEPAA